MARRWSGAFLVVAMLLAGCREGDEDRQEAPPDTVAVPGQDTTPVAAGPTCSARGLEPGPVDTAGLPPGVAETRAAILEAALACDYVRLDSLALAGGTPFIYSFGDGGSPGAYWRELEAGGQGPLDMLVRTLSLPWARESFEVEPLVYYVWPSAYVIGAGEEDWAALEELYSTEDIEFFREAGSFFGYRVGITETGDWRFFVAGD